MSIFGGQTSRHTLASLDETGRLAAIYPSEDQLWLYGPTINDPGGQGVAVEHAPSPDPAETPAWVQDTMEGPTPNGAYGEEWVNLAIGGPAGFGNWNEQPYQTGHSQIVQSDPGAEQGWGVGPARRWAHYPFSELQNPTRNMGKHLRMGQAPTAGSPETVYSQRTAEAWELQWQPFKQRVPVNPVVPVATTVPFTQTVPTFAGGPENIPGLDVPITDTGSGIY